MRAVALGLLGYGTDADDAVQDAMLTAMSKLGGLRDPAAAGPWLRAIVRNCCRMRLRARRDLPLSQDLPLVSGGLTPEAVLEDISPPPSATGGPPTWNSSTARAGRATAMS